MITSLKRFFLALALAAGIFGGAACFDFDDCDDHRRECMNECDACSSCDSYCYDDCDDYCH